MLALTIEFQTYKVYSLRFLMAGINDSFIDLERHRRQLEDNVAELRKSLQYWQTWEAEYEGLREQLQGLGDEPTEQELV